MGYGAHARRVPASGGAGLTDVDIYKVLLLIRAERGFENTIQKEIYSMSDFYLKCGGYNTSYYGAYVAKSFFDELEDDINCEMKVLGYVDAAATQATYDIMDQATPAVKIFDCDAGRKNVSDESAFGNKIAIKIEHVDEITMKLTANVLDGATTAYLDSVDNLQVGYYVLFKEGSDEEVRVITAINPATKMITFAAISESGGFTSAGATVYRLDWNIKVAVKDDLGNYQDKEEWEGPFAKSDTIGLAYDINNSESGSNFIKLTANASNASLPELQRPTELSTWTPLTGGADGASPNDAAWLALAEAQLENEEFTIMLAPESYSVTHAQNMTNFCTEGYKGIFYSQAANAASEDTLKNFGASCRGSVKFGMLPSDKWIRVDDPTVYGGLKEIPKVGVDAAHWFNTYTKFGESKVAAGNKSEMVLKCSSKLLDSNGLVHDDKTGVGGRLIRNYSVNICKYTRGKGITNNSARTFSTDDGYKFQNQVMQWILYARSIVAYLKTIEQDQAGYDAQKSHYSEVWAYMKSKYDEGHLYHGQKEDGQLMSFGEVCVIKNDFTINTLANINNGIEEIFVQMICPPPIEEPVLSLASAGVTVVRA